MKIKYGFKILQTKDALYDGNVYIDPCTEL